MSSFLRGSPPFLLWWRRWHISNVLAVRLYSISILLLPLFIPENLRLAYRKSLRVSRWSRRLTHNWLLNVGGGWGWRGMSVPVWQVWVWVKTKDTCLPLHSTPLPPQPLFFFLLLKWMQHTRMFPCLQAKMVYARGWGWGGAYNQEKNNEF